MSNYDHNKGRKLGYLIDRRMLCDDCAEDKYLLTGAVKNNTISTAYTCSDCGKNYFRGYLQLN
jgi:hypothetical protein